MERRIVPDVIGQRQQLLELPASATAREAARRMCERKVGAVLVTDAGTLQGIFTERDLMHRVIAAGRDPDATRLGEVMTPDPDTVDADDYAIDALALMSERGHLPVLEKGRIVGIVSRRDFLGEEIIIVEDELGHEQRFWPRAAAAVSTSPFAAGAAMLRPIRNHHRAGQPPCADSFPMS